MAEDDRSRSGVNLLHLLTELIRQGDAERFAEELGLEPVQTRAWFDQRFPHVGYGVEVTNAIGTMALDRLILVSARGGGHAADQARHG